MGTSLGRFLSEYKETQLVAQFMSVHVYRAGQ